MIVVVTKLASSLGGRVGTSALHGHFGSRLAPLLDFPSLEFHSPPTSSGAQTCSELTTFGRLTSGPPR